MHRQVAVDRRDSVASPIRSRLTASRCCILVVALAACAPNPVEREQLPLGPLEFVAPASEGLHWYKGNTHAHTTNSDGDTSPLGVATWYKKHGYNFLVISDHNVFTAPLEVREILDSSFIVVPGEEITVGVVGVPVHINGINIPQVIAWNRAHDQLSTLQANVYAVLSVGGVAQVNHPNLDPGLDIGALEQLGGARLLEIHNAISVTNNDGGNGRPSTGEIWDRMLTAGRVVYGVASDDAHYLDYFHPLRANPGRAWVMVRAAALTPVAVSQALENGNFYSSTGVAVEEISVEPRRITIAHTTVAGDSAQTRFIGAGGKVLLETRANPASYEATGEEGYVRAEIARVSGAKAWIQPIFLRYRPR